jgi:hypothetical protein
MFFCFLSLELWCRVWPCFTGPQAAQGNEKPPPESFLDLTLTQHLHDEDSKSQKVRTRLEIKPFRAWYYCISSNSRTLVILLQIDPAFGDEPKTVYEGCYETADISIFAWFLIFDVGKLLLVA